MTTNTRIHFLFTLGLLFLALSCGPDGSDILRPSDILDVTQTLLAETKESPNTQAPVDPQGTYNTVLAPILTERCAIRGCHVTGGPKNLDFTTYSSFTKGGDEGPIFIPGNANDSTILKEIVSGRMPPYGDPLTPAQIQAFRDWINQSAAEDSSDDDTPDSQTSVFLDTPDAVEITHYNNRQLTERAPPTVRDGITIFTKVVFAKNAPYRVANDSSARPDIRYILSRSDGSKVERRYRIVPRDSTGSDFVSADCKPIEGTKVFVCKYTLPVSDFTEFSVNVLGIVLDGTSLKIDSKRVREQQEVQQPLTPQVVSFEQDLLPILRGRCAFAGCHVAGGPKNLDFSTYQSFLNGGDKGSVFVAGDAASSDIIEEIVSGRMPPGGPPLTHSQVQLFRDWINQQPSTATPMRPQQPSTQQPQPPGNTTEPETSFNQNLLPILRARCAYSGCHDANGYDGLDFRTYQSFIRGDDEGESVFIPGNARSSDIIEEIVSGRMPPGGPPVD